MSKSQAKPDNTQRELAQQQAISMDKLRNRLKVQGKAWVKSKEKFKAEIKYLNS